jgi:hypothetical protein
MQQVYIDASLTIAARLARSVNEGIFSKRVSAIEPIQVTWSSSSLGASNVLYIADLRPWRKWPPNRLPLYERRWTLQEDVLSRRVLLYEGDRMSWKCMRERDYKGGGGKGPSSPFKDHVHDLLRTQPATPTPISRHGYPFQLRELRFRWLPAAPPPLSTRIAFHDNWEDLLEAYSLCHLTHISDALPALSGLALVFGNSTGDKYCAGLWKSNLLHSLLWHRFSRDSDNLLGFPDNHIGRKTILKSPETYLAPSWSWASILGGKIA